MEKVQAENPVSPEELKDLCRRVKEFVENNKIEEFQPFTFQGINFQLLRVEGEDDHDNTWFNVSTEIDGFDINIPFGIPEKEFKRKLFHEILVVTLRQRGWDEGDAGSLARAEDHRLFGLRPTTI